MFCSYNNKQHYAPNACFQSVLVKDFKQYEEEEEPEVVYMDDDEEDGEVIQLEKVEDKKYLPGCKLLEKLKKQKKEKIKKNKKKSEIDEERLCKAFGRLVKMF